MKILIAEHMDMLSTHAGIRAAEMMMRRHSALVSDRLVGSIASQIGTKVIEEAKMIPWKNDSRMLTTSTLDLLCDSPRPCCFKR